MQRTSPQTPYRESLRERILITSTHAFVSRGIKAVKMDDIAKDLSISKRTLYEIYHNKEELLLECVKYETQMDEEMMRDFVDKNHPNVMEILLHFYHLQMMKYSHATPQYLEGIDKYERVTDFLAKKHEKVSKERRNFFQDGVKEGFFRADFDYDIIGEIGDATMHHVMESQLYKKYPLQKIFYNAVNLFVRGFCTEKGLRVMDSLSTSGKGVKELSL